MIHIAVDSINLRNLVHRTGKAIDKVLWDDVRARVILYLENSSDPGYVNIALDPQEMDLLRTLILSVETRFREELKEQL